MSDASKKIEQAVYEGKEIFLRFTSDAQRDMERGRSLWFYPNMSDAEAKERKANGDAMVWVDDFGMHGAWAQEHHGLSGHQLRIDDDTQIETLQDALRAVEQGSWYMDPQRDAWALFIGERADTRQQGYVSTPEGDDFTPEAVAYVHKGGAQSSAS